MTATKLVQEEEQQNSKNSTGPIKKNKSKKKNKIKRTKS